MGQEKNTDLLALYEHCRLCPRECGVDRRAQAPGRPKGFCGEAHIPRIAFIGPHFGEEPPITGTNGSGTVFFSGCPLRCIFCQNHQISRGMFGKPMDLDAVIMHVEDMIGEKGVHNINMVTPDHFFPHVFLLTAALRRQGHKLPVVYNLSGYQSLQLIRMAESHVDIYLPDFKYADPALAAALSKAGDYPEVALDALSEMVRQKGFLDSSFNGSAIAQKGVLVRHLILPGEVENSLNVLTTLFLEFGPDIPVSLMSQYHPVGNALKGDLARPLKTEEFDAVYGHAKDLGFCNLFIQFPDPQKEGLSPRQSPFLPDFHMVQPFGKPDRKNMQSAVDIKKMVC